MAAGLPSIDPEAEAPCPAVADTPGAPTRRLPLTPRNEPDKMDKQHLLNLRMELESLVIDYWHEVDVNGGQSAPGYYTADALFETSVRQYRGIAEIEAFYQRRQSRGPRVSIHVVNNFRVQPQSDTRVACSYVISLFAADGAPVLPSRPAILFGFADEVMVQQADARWLCASRRIRALFRDETPTTG